MLQEYILISLNSFIKILDDVHKCEKDNTSQNKFSFTNDSNFLQCARCDLHVVSNYLKFFSNYQSFTDEFPPHTNICQYEEIICINEDFEHINDEGKFTELTSIESIFVEPSDSPIRLQTCDETDPLSMEAMNVKCLDNLSEDYSDMLGITDASKKTPKIVTWTSDSFVVANKNSCNNKQKYPSTLVCEYCGIVFKGKDRVYKLFYHRNKIHTNSVKFKCNVCQRIYWGEREYSYHVLSHSNPMSICEVCGIQFTRKQDLNRHALTHDKKQLSCMYCPKKFNRKDNLKVHERLHTGHFPFICQMCGSGFPQNHQLKLHKRKCPFLKSNKPYSEIDTTS